MLFPGLWVKSRWQGPSAEIPAERKRAPRLGDAREGRCRMGVSGSVHTCVYTT